LKKVEDSLKRLKKKKERSDADQRKEGIPLFEKKKAFGKEEAAKTSVQRTDQEIFSEKGGTAFKPGGGRGAGPDTSPGEKESSRSWGRKKTLK